MHGIVKGVALAQLIVLLYALAFLLYYGLEPVPRDHHSSWQIALSVATTTLVVGTVVAAPIGAAIGALSVRLRRHRASTLAAVALLGGLVAPIIAASVLPVRGLFVLSSPGIVLSPIAALVLARWTRPRVSARGNEDPAPAR